MVMRGRAFVSVVLSVSIPLSGCATATPGLSLGGRTVELRGTVPESAKVSGELLSVGPEQMLVLTPEGVREIRTQHVKEARVRRHGLDGAKAWLWVAVGALGTGVALSTACSNAEGSGNCGAVLGVTAGIWALLGGASAAALSKSSRLRIEGPDFTTLKPYARFPQGLPEGVDPATLQQQPTERR